MKNVGWKKIESNHENTHEVSVQDKSKQHENSLGLLRDFDLS
jgi:hypothetical protein